MKNAKDVVAEKRRNIEYINQCCNEKNPRNALTIRRKIRTCEISCTQDEKRDYLWKNMRSKAGVN